MGIYPKSSIGIKISCMMVIPLLRGSLSRKENISSSRQGRPSVTQIPEVV